MNSRDQASFILYALACAALAAALVLAPVTGDARPVGADASPSHHLD